MSIKLRRSIGFAGAEHTLEVDARRLPTYAQLSRAMNQLVTERDGEWCGTPMPLPGMRLVLEDKHPQAALTAELQRIVDDEHPEEVTPDDHAADPASLRVVNSWYSFQKGGTVLMIRDGDRLCWGLDAAQPRRNRMLFGPFETMDAWELDVELTAIERLAELLSPRMFAAYILSGGFLERSTRSGLSYFFRRCRPTLALSPRPGRRALENPDADHGMRVICALCLHPLGYYAETFMGAMVPTDDVIAHLLLMRGDEAMFWRRANQHAPYLPEAGL